MIENLNTLHEAKIIIKCICWDCPIGIIHPKWWIPWIPESADNLSKALLIFRPCGDRNRNNEHCAVQQELNLDINVSLNSS